MSIYESIIAQYMPGLHLETHLATNISHFIVLAQKSVCLLASPHAVIRRDKMSPGGDDLC